MRAEVSRWVPGGRSARHLFWLLALVGVASILAVGPGLSSPFLTGERSVPSGPQGPLGSPLGASSANSRALAAPEPTAISGPSAGSVVRTVFPDYNATLPGNFPWRVRDWEIGNPTYVPPTDTLWLPNRAVSTDGLSPPPLAPAVVFNATTNQFTGFELSVEGTAAFAFDPLNGYLYSADYSNNTVGVIDPVTGAWVTPAIPVGQEPDALALDLATNSLYVANAGSNNLTIINCDRQAISQPGINIGQRPISLAFDEYDQRLFIADGSDSYVRAMSTVTNASVGTILLRGVPAGITYSSASRNIAVTVPSDSHLVLANASSLTYLTPTVGNYAGPVALNSTGTEFILGNLRGSNLVLVDASSGAVLSSTIAVGSNVTGLASVAGTSKVFAWANESRNLTEVDLVSDRAVRSSSSLGPEPWDVAYAPAPNRLFVADPTDGTVVVLNATTGRTVTPPIVAPSPPVSVAVDDASNVLYVGTESGVVSYNAMTLARLAGKASIAGGNSPVMVDDLDQLLWVVNGANGLHALHLGSLAPVFTVPIQPGFQAMSGMALDPALHELFVINHTGGYVEAVNSSTGSIDDPRIPSGAGPAAIAYDGEDDSLYVAGANLTVVDPGTRQIVGTTILLPAHYTTSSIVYDPTRSYLYLTTSLAGPARASTVTVLDGSSVAASSASQVSELLGQSASSVTPVSFAGSEPPSFSSVWVTNALSGTLSVIASPPQISFFTASPSAIDRGQPVQFLVGYSGGTGPDSVSYSGLPTGCASANVTELNCTPTIGGSFSVTATVTDEFGYSASASTTLTVAPSLEVRTTFRPGPTPTLDAGMNLTANATAAGGVPAYSYAWSFGDGSTLVGANVTHRYSSAGTYLISVTVSDADHAAVTDSSVVTVHPAPGAAISVSPRNATDVGVPLAFEATVSGGTGAGNGSWTFGDGANSTGLTATHHWNRSGGFPVTFRYVDALGVPAVDELNVTVAPALAGTFSTSVGGSGIAIATPVSFSATLTGGVGPYNITWAFGDGTFAYGPRVGHAFASPGTYSVRAVASDSAGSVVNTTLTVVVSSSGGTTTLGRGGATPDAQLFVGILVGFALGAVVLFAISRARKRSPPPPSPYVPPEVRSPPG